MLDIKFIRENPQVVQKAAKDKGIDIDINHVLEIDSKHRELALFVQKLREERNLLTSGIRGKPTETQVEKGKNIKDRLEKEEHALRAIGEELKRKLGLKQIDENIVNEAMSALIDMMVFETKKTITNYESSKNQKISRVLLVGGLANMPNFVDYFKQKLGRDVFIANSFARIAYPQGLSSIIQELTNTFSVAAGLAMRDI